MGFYVFANLLNCKLEYNDLHPSTVSLYMFVHITIALPSDNPNAAFLRIFFALASWAHWPFGLSEEFFEVCALACAVHVCTYVCGLGQQTL